MPSSPGSAVDAASCPNPRPTPRPLPHVGVSPPQSAPLRQVSNYPGDAGDLAGQDCTPAMADGLACVVCGVDYLAPGSPPHVPVGRAATGSQVFACTTCCGEE